jgi:hypothetical protein
MCTPIILPPEIPYIENSFSKHYAQAEIVFGKKL